MARRGKVSAFNKVLHNKEFQTLFHNLGQSWKPNENVVIDIEKFTCLLYGQKTNSVNECRYKIFCARRGDIESNHLPPCLDCLRKHVLRANYQAKVWLQSLHAAYEVPPPDSLVLKLDHENSKLSVSWKDGLPAPLSVLELLTCTCSRKCEAPTCPCITS